jgi:shikimate kinase
MASDPAPSVVLIGMMGSGKSTVGRALAGLTGWRYLDNDELVGIVSGRRAEDIDADDGEVALHQVEADALRLALSMPRPLVVGAAAWVVEHQPSVELLRAQPAVIYLRAQPETLRSRIDQGSGRRRDATDLAWLRARAAEREAAYLTLARVVIDTDGLEPMAIARRILEAL